MQVEHAFGDAGRQRRALVGEGGDQPARLGGRSAAVTSSSRRRESSSTSQTRPAPITSPTMSSHQLNSAFTAAKDTGGGLPGPRRGARYTPRMFTATPDPIALTIGPLAIGWYGLGYALGLAAAYLLLVWLAKRAGEDPDLVGNGIIIVAVAALIGGRLYHVIDQWDLYKDDLASIVLPPYSGLGAYGGLATGIAGGRPVHPLEARPVLALGRHHRAVGVRDAGHRSLGQLLQPGAVRAADHAAVGHPHRLRVPRGGLPVRRLPVRHDALPPAVPVRVAVRVRSGPRSSSGSASASGTGCGRATC